MVRLSYIDPRIFSAYLIDAWQHELDTEDDPTSGKWYFHGPDGSPGLMGALNDSIITDLTIHDKDGVLSKNREIAMSTTVDNSAGTFDDYPVETMLSWDFQNLTSTKQQTTGSVRSGISMKFGGKGSFPFFGEVRQEYAITLEYAYGWQTEEATVKVDIKKFRETVPFKVPHGKVYKLIVMADKVDLRVPYDANILVHGHCETNFERPVKGQKQWRTDIGTIFDWIDKFGSAKEDNMKFKVLCKDKSVGIASIRGELTSDQAVNFSIYAVDVTRTLESDPYSSDVVEALISGRGLPYAPLLTVMG